MTGEYSELMVPENYSKNISYSQSPMNNHAREYNKTPLQQKRNPNIEAQGTINQDSLVLGEDILTQQTLIQKLNPQPYSLENNQHTADDNGGVKQLQLFKSMMNSDKGNNSSPQNDNQENL